MMDFVSVSDKTGSISSLMEEKAAIAVYVPQLFHLKKFICSDSELLCTGKIAQFFYNRLTIPERIQENWWAGAVSKVRKSIDNKRATVAMAIKTEFMHKYTSKWWISWLSQFLSYYDNFYITGLKSTDKLPTLTQLQSLQKDYETMEIFCNHLLASEFGKHDWKWQTKHRLVCDIVTISDKAFALLVLENI